MSWSLYELSRHPDVQASLRAEVKSVLGDRLVPGAADVARMPLMKAVVKEVLRYVPGMFIHVRIGLHRVGHYRVVRISTCR